MIEESGLQDNILNEIIRMKNIKSYTDQYTTTGNSIGINGTPTFIIGQSLLIGNQSFDSFLNALVAANYLKDP